MGDIGTAWASLTPDGQREWLELTYAEPVKAVEVYVYETYNPGAIDKVTLFDGAGREHVRWRTAARTVRSGRGGRPPRR